MDQLFAPWRIEWVERDDRNPDVDCVFCEYPDRDDAREHLVVARSDHAVVMLNNYPYNPGHVMVIPRQHTGRFEGLDRSVLVDHAQLKQETIAALDEGMDPDGCNVGMNLGGDAAGGSIDDHVHTHIVPRWQGDSNFMAVIGDTSVIVEALSETYERLHDAFAQRPGATVPGPDAAVEIDLSDR
ncbi:HIT family protein [Halococcoides cellulosivorans]|uniref:HIT family hydrolase n=1 Tax=Halococcoides cellulosivorans TaxID=1679096 RepID=A0A2R4WYI7_9EURY|nr:HIT domain-containing protein [Halococcoides cellulosivorans]AWB26609.1 HIT family hydrolase [Halococcoides cellulosivorans]